MSYLIPPTCPYKDGDLTPELIISGRESIERLEFELYNLQSSLDFIKEIFEIMKDFKNWLSGEIIPYLTKVLKISRMDKLELPENAKVKQIYCDTIALIRYSFTIMFCWSRLFNDHSINSDDALFKGCGQVLMIKFPDLDQNSVFWFVQSTPRSGFFASAAVLEHLTHKDFWVNFIFYYIV